MPTLRILYLIVIALAAVSCSTTPAPVIDRTPAAKPASTDKVGNAVSTASKSASAKQSTADWRPDTHTVRKGDTLFSIGLEYGYDYKDIARVNNIEAPYIIKVGQVLKLGELKDKPGSAEARPEGVQQDNDVATYPLSDDGGISTAHSTTTAATPVIASLKAPKALREPYSDEALKAALTPPKAASTAKPVDKAEVLNTDSAVKEVKPDSPSATKLPVESAGAIAWSWPAKGKIIAGFNEGGNKGIDIAGVKGQPVLAAAPGKVIYSGSDLRGYGKMVIVKHNSTYLSVYANNSNIVVKEGQQVTLGQKIAEMGSSDSNVVKLHFEIRQQGKSVDPAKFLSPS